MPMRACQSLDVVVRVPIRVVDDDRVGRRQVEPEPASARRQQHDDGQRTLENEVNLYVWMGLLGGLGGLVEMVSGLLLWYAYDEAHVMYYEDDSTTAEVTAAAVVMAAIKEEMMMGAIDSLGIEFALNETGKDWAEYQMKAAGYEGKGKGGRKGEDWSDCSEDDEECMEMMKEKKDGDKPPKPENLFRSEERRGKECRSRWSPYH